VYVPDPASVGQHLHDVAVELVQRGLRVIVFTSDRGYEDPSKRYPRHETRAGVHVFRVPLSSFGKRSVPLRLAGAMSFLSSATLLALSLRRIDRVLISTSPPMAALAALTVQAARNVPFSYWIMDLNPDQIVALGNLAPDAALVRAMDWLNARALERARHVITLDHFMAARVNAKRAVAAKLAVIPPWPHLRADETPIDHADNAFRTKHGFGGARVVMYSGNLSPVHPVATLIDAAARFQHDPRLLFVFIGGGLGRDEIERAKRERSLLYVRTLPYQPLSALRQSLSAADVHVVAMGNSMVGIVHPSKIYGAMAAGRPILALGPKSSHVAELVATEKIGWVVPHGDVDAAARVLEEIAGASPDSLRAMGRRAQHVAQRRFNSRVLIGQICNVLTDTSDEARG
jgi:glycosyltransferase involved in cell wall biosynthesis